jgi:hypothetical protein
MEKLWKATLQGTHSPTGNISLREMFPTIFFYFLEEKEKDHLKRGDLLLPETMG